MTIKNMLDMRFGRWTVVGRAANRDKKAVWVCRCECGTEAEVQGGNLRSGKSTQCVICRNKQNSLTTHGMTNSPTHQTWSNMLARCRNPNSSHYDRYGGRGISVCEAWERSFEAFLADMGERPEGMTLDRINNDGDYTPENCRWADVSTQRRNTSRRRMITVAGTTKHLLDWAKETGIPAGTLHDRLSRGVSPEDAIR